jgi:hypothetical protein
MRRPGRRSGHVARGPDPRPGHFASHRLHQFEASGRSAGRSPKNTVEKMAPATRNTSTRQSATAGTYPARSTSRSPGGTMVVTASAANSFCHPR